VPPFFDFLVLDRRDCRGGQRSVVRGQLSRLYK
jgi:hypothetical protein